MDQARPEQTTTSTLFNLDSTGKRTIKCVIVGDGGTGKTCMLFRYTTGKFPGPEYIPTIMDNYNANITIRGEEFGLDVWDTAGQEEYEHIRQLSYPSTSVFIVCYAVNRLSSFENIEKLWLPEIFKHQKGVPFILCGTKLDLEDSSAVGKAKSSDLAAKYQAFANVSCSAMSGENMKVVFDQAIKCVYSGGIKPDVTGRYGRRRKCKLM